MSALTLFIAMSMATASARQAEEAARTAKLERAFQQQKNTPSVQQIVEANRRNYKTSGDSARGRKR